MSDLNDRNDGVGIVSLDLHAGHHLVLNGAVVLSEASAHLILQGEGQATSVLPWRLFIHLKNPAEDVLDAAGLENTCNQ